MEIITIVDDHNPCEISNEIFQIYFTYIFIFVLPSSLSMFIALIFGSLALHNVKQISYRAMTLAQYLSDKYLTAAVLEQAIYNVRVIAPILSHIWLILAYTWIE